MKKSIILLIILTSAFVACKKKSSSSSSYTPTCTSTKSFQNDANPLIQSNCVSCHSNYSTYTQIKANASAIRSSIVNGSMPKNSSMTADQKDKIVCWIDAGCPNN